MDAANPVSVRVRYMLALIRALDSCGGTSRPDNVYAWLEANGERFGRPPPAGVDPEMHFRREVRFARQELADADILARTPGIWTLADRNRALSITTVHAVEIIGENRRRRDERRSEGGKRRRADTGSRISPGASAGPPPTHGEISFARADGPASTYIFQYGKSDLWKIGYTADIPTRLAEVNRHLPTENLVDEWRCVRRRRWPSQMLAFAMEQDILDRLAPWRTRFERVRCDPGMLNHAWAEAAAAVAAGTARHCAPKTEAASHA